MMEENSITAVRLEHRSRAATRGRAHRHHARLAGAQDALFHHECRLMSGGKRLEMGDITASSRAPLIPATVPSGASSNTLTMLNLNVERWTFAPIFRRHQHRKPCEVFCTVTFSIQRMLQLLPPSDLAIYSPKSSRACLERCLASELTFGFLTAAYNAASQ